MSSRHIYLSAQRRYIAFCKEDLKTAPDSSALPADEKTLMRFCTMLADSMDYSCIKIYLFAVRSLHIDNGLPDPFINCLQLPQLVRGIKHAKNRRSPARLFITLEIMRAIHQSLDFSEQDNVMFWAACCLGYFGFLRIGEFTVNSSFNPDIHMTVSDVEADSEVNPTFFKVHIKCSKEDPFRKECHIYVGRGDTTICPFVAISNYLEVRGSVSGPLFLNRDGSPLSKQKLSRTVQSVLHSTGLLPPGKRSGCSFRSGAATTASTRGLPGDLIKTLCRRSIDAYEAYSRTPVISILRVTSQLV